MPSSGLSRLADSCYPALQNTAKRSISCARHFVPNIPAGVVMEGRRHLQQTIVIASTQQKGFRPHYKQKPFKAKPISPG